MERDFITVVSGLPRSGTSLMMQMLDAGGIGPLTDRVRTADEDNPRGYYEFEPVKQTKRDAGWVPSAVGKAVKMIYQLLYDLPPEFAYRVVFMERKIEEVLASQRTMLERQGAQGAKLTDEQLAKVFGAQVAKCKAWLAAQPNFTVAYVSYNDLVADPRPQADVLSAFLGGLDVDAMASVVDPSLYRQRR